MEFLKQTFTEFSKNNCSTLAAALAYYTAFALPPLLYLLLTVLTLGLSVMYEGDEAQKKAQGVLTEQASEMLGNEAAAAQINTILKNNSQETGKWWKTVLSFAGIVVGATGVVAALQTALNQVWEVQPDPGKAAWKTVLIKRLTSLAMIVALGFLLLLSLVVSSVLSAMGDQVGSLVGMSSTVASLVNFLVPGLIVLLVFAAIFKFMPDAEIRWQDVWVGAALTTILFILGRYALELYFSYSSPGAQLGAAAASLAVLLVWVYYSAMIVLLGAEATQVYAVQYGNGVRPQSGAVRVVKKIQRGDSDAS